MAISLTLGFLHVDFFGLKITMKPSPPEDTPVLEVTIFQGSWPWICWESMGIHQIHRHAKTTILSNEKKGPRLVWLYRGWNSTQFNCSFGRIIWFLVVLFWCFFSRSHHSTTIWDNICLHSFFIRRSESQIQGCFLLTYMAYQRIRKDSGTPLPIWLAYCITLVDFGSRHYFRIGCYWSFGVSL